MYLVYSALRKLQEVRMGVEYSSLCRCLELCHPGHSRHNFLLQAGKDSILHHLCSVHPVTQHLVLMHFCWTETLLFQQVNNKCSQGLRKLISLHNANYVKQEWKSLLEYKPVIRKLLDWFIANESTVKCFRGVQLGEKCTHRGSFSKCIEKSSSRCWKRDISSVEQNAPGKKTT